MLENFDPSTIEDPALRQLVQTLMNQLEELHAKIRAQAEAIQRLRDENNRLKGEQAKPEFKPNKETTPNRGSAGLGCAPCIIISKVSCLLHRATHPSEPFKVTQGPRDG